MSTLITDFGSKIGGARKDLKGSMRLEDLHGMTHLERVKYVRRDFVWPIPDFEALVAAGMTREAAVAIKEIRAACPKLPLLHSEDSETAFAERCERYATALNTLRTIETAKTLSELGARFCEAGTPLTALTGVVTVTRRDSGPPDAFLRAEQALSSAFGHKLSDLRYAIRCAGAGALSREAQRLLRSNPDWPGNTGAVPTLLRQLDLSIRQNTQGCWAVAFGGETADKPIGRYHLSLLSSKAQSFETLATLTFPSKEAGCEILNKAAQAVLDAKKATRKVRAKLVPPPTEGENQFRTGPEYRSGPATAEQYLTEFKLRGGEFGNWVKQKERQDLLDKGYDAFRDLAAVLGYHPAQLSLNGTLAIAFGARGSGVGAGQFAHYEPEREVINLTKPNGEGSLAHEWAHALDHHLHTRAVALGITKPSLDYYLSGCDLKDPSPDEGAEARQLRSIKAAMTSLKERPLEPEAAKKHLTESVAALEKRFAKNLAYIRENFFFDNKPDAAEKYARFDASCETLKTAYKGQCDRAALEAALQKHRAVIGELIGSKSKERIGYHDTNGEYYLWQFYTLNNSVKRHTGPSPEPYLAKTKFYEKSREQDKIEGKKTPYYPTPHEMFARALHASVYDALRATDQRSPFLAYPAANIEMLNLFHFPEGAEREAFNRDLGEAIRGYGPFLSQGEDIKRTTFWAVDGRTVPCHILSQEGDTSKVRLHNGAQHTAKSGDLCETETEAKDRLCAKAKDTEIENYMAERHANAI